MRKGFVSINIIIIMIILNIIVLSLFSMNKNLINSRILSIKNKEEKIYQNSKINIIDYKITEAFKKSIEDFKTQIAKDDAVSNSLLKTLVNKNIQNMDMKDFLMEIQIRIDETITKFGEYTIRYEISFPYDESRRRKVLYYEISVPEFTYEDREEIKSGNEEEIFKKYQSNLISKKLVY